MDWLARPPDMNPIEHVWDCLQRRIVASNFQCVTRESLELELLDDRGMIPLADIRKGTSRQRSGKGAIRKRFPLQKPRWEKTKLTIRYLYHETYRKPNEQLFSLRDRKIQTDCKQSLRIGKIRALNGCTGRLFRAATRHNHKLI